jgi:hypothetical protein
VGWRNWWIERDGDRTDLTQVLAGWDYASNEIVGISVDIHEEALLKSTGLESLEDLEILVMADCPSVQQRFVAASPLHGHQPGTAIDVTLQLPPGQVAVDVRLSAHVVLARTTPYIGNRVAFLRGARIHSSETFTLRLEGESGRFPTEPVSFSELPLGNAPWTILAVYDDLSDSFLGGIRLLINTDHPVGRLSLDSKARSRVSGLLHADVLRLLIANMAARGDNADDDSAFEEGSVGQVLETMCQVFLGMTLRAAVLLYRDDPAYFDILLHNQFDPLGGVTA